MFVFGYAKSGQDDLAKDELVDVRTAAKLFLGYDSEQLDEAVANEELWASGDATVTVPTMGAVALHVGARLN